MSEITNRIKAVRATGTGSRKSSHPLVIHWLVEELKSAKGSSDGLSLAALATFLTEKGYKVAKMQLHGMVYSAAESHDKKVAAFQELLDAGNEEAEAQLAQYLPDADESATA
jgi:predicted alpha/beta-hydrolase family hydrolase